MAEHPLLIFPEPEHAERAKGNYHPGSTIRFPSAQTQDQRLTPQFQRLQQAMEQRRLALQDDPIGTQPEQVLVLETVGSIQNFAKAVKWIKGLEWLSELEIDDISPDYGFEYEENPEKSLKGQLFLVMTDQRALQEIRSLFDRWKIDNNMKFPHGLAPLKHVFGHLHTIRPWGAEDRIRDTGILEDWNNRIEYAQEVVPFEVELWFRGNQDRQRQAETDLGRIIESLNGEIVQRCVIPQIYYHGVLGKIPAESTRELFSETAELQDFELLRCEGIMRLRPVGQCAIRVPEDTLETDQIETEQVEQESERNLPQNQPVVALLDGLPLARHRHLNERLIIDDPDGFESDYQAGQRIHGTAMASLICHGDLNETSKPVERSIYVRPIMKPYRDFNQQDYERIPEEILPIDLVHRAVKRLYESEGGQPPIAPNIRVINLSVCDPAQPFARRMSAWARLLDWLSWQYKVLFVVSAGNHSHDINLNVPRAEFRGMTQEDSEAAVIMAVAEDTRHRRLLSPAETLNGLTVGATHEDASLNQHSSTLIDPFEKTGHPGTYSAHGPGYRRSIKPDILLPGGKQVFLEQPVGTHPNAILQAAVYKGPPGQLVATPGNAGELNKTKYTNGTSNATALASRWANFLYDVIGQIRTQNGPSHLPTEYDTVLLKALLVHGADWTNSISRYKSVLKNSDNSHIFKDYIGHFFGYGSANISKVAACTDQRVTILGAGKLADGDGHVFSFPLPPSLSTVAVQRRLTITLAWLTPVNSASQKYRIAQLWYEPRKEDKLLLNRVDADWHAVKRGTVQHEVLEGDKAVDFQDGDSIAIKVNCRADAGGITEPIRYGLAVTLEVSEELDIPIYQEVRNRIRIRIPAQDERST